MKWNNVLLAMLAGVALWGQSAGAQTLVDNFTFDGGGLDPATYGGAFRPDPLVADTGSTGGGTISVFNLTSGGLGSSGYPAGYGGMYTHFSTSPSFTYQTSTLLSGVDVITFSLYAGGGSPALISYDASSLTLNYNGSNPAVASSGFSTGTPVVVSTPLGPQTLTPYTWTWTNVSALGSSTGFSISWDTDSNQFCFFTDISATQAVPEPTVVGLIALGGGLLFAARRKRRISSDS